MNKSVLVLLVISFTNPWFWKILNVNIFLGLSIAVTSFSQFILISSQKWRLKYLITTIFMFIILSAFGIKLGYDQDLKIIKVDEQIQLDQRNRYYSKDLGELFLNKYVLNYYQNYNPYISKFQHNFFANLDPNLYFFASHPRERAGINEFEKFPSFYFLFFLLGIIYILQLQPKRLMLYFFVAALIGGLISPAFELGPILFFPLVTSLTTLGVIYSTILFKFCFKKIH